MSTYLYIYIYRDIYRHIYIYVSIYLDLLYGTYFCRCSKTLELSPFLRKNAVPENKYRCEKLSAHVVGYFRGLVGYFRRLVGHFHRWKTGLAINISEETLVCTKRSLFCKIYLLDNGQKAEIKPTLEEAGM